MTDSQDWIYDLIKSLPKFHGLAHEDPYRHLKEFCLVCLSMRPPGVSKETVLMKVFPMSLQGAARDWFLYQYPFDSWQETQQRFLNKFFPAAKVSNIRREITTIEQFQEESLADYWERFNRLCTACPNHQISEHLLLIYFYEGLLDNERILVDVAAGGSLMDRTPTEAKKLLCKLVGQNPSEVVKEKPEQVCCKLEIPTHVSEVQVNFNAFELVKLEPFKPVLDSDIDTHVHTHVVDSLFPVEHIDIPDVHYPCTDLDLNDSLEDAADDLEIGKKNFSEQKQVYFELEIPNSLPDLLIHSNACDLMHTDSIGFMTDTDTDLIDHSKIFDSVSAIEPIGLRVVLNGHDCRDEILIDNSLELTFDSVDDAYINIDFEVETVQSDNSIELGLNFDLTQFSENFECDCESGSCPICIEIDYVLQTDSKRITDAINCEFDDHVAELIENTGADIKEIVINEGECTATSLIEPGISIPMSHTEQLQVEGKLLMEQFAGRRKKKHLVLDDMAVLMKLVLLKTRLLNLMVEDISLKVQNWQLPP